MWLDIISLLPFYVDVFQNIIVPGEGEGTLDSVSSTVAGPLWKTLHGLTGVRWPLQLTHSLHVGHFVSPWHGWGTFSVPGACA